MSADWAQEARRVLRAWQHRHPAFQVRRSYGSNMDATRITSKIVVCHGLCSADAFCSLGRGG